MSHEVEGQLVTFYCDVTGCEATFSAAGSFKDVWEAAKQDGWRCFKNDEDEWEHRCPECRGR